MSGETNSLSWLKDTTSGESLSQLHQGIELPSQIQNQVPACNALDQLSDSLIAFWYKPLHSITVLIKITVQRF